MPTPAQPVFIPGNLYWAKYNGDLCVAKFVTSDDHPLEPNNFNLTTINEDGSLGSVIANLWLGNPRNGVIDNRSEWHAIVYVKRPYMPGKSFLVDHRKLPRVRSSKRFDLKALK